MFRHCRPDQVSCVGYVFLSAPSPCERLSRSPSITSGSDFLQTFGSPPFWSGSPTCLPLPCPSLVRLGSGLLPFPGFPFCGSLSVCLASVFRSFPPNQESEGSPKFSNASFHAYHALRWTPADPREPHQNGPSVWASGSLTPSPSALNRANGAVSSFGECGLPCGLRDSLCTLQWFRSVHVELPPPLQHSVQVGG